MLLRRLLIEAAEAPWLPSPRYYIPASIIEALAGQARRDSRPQSQS